MKIICLNQKENLFCFAQEFVSNYEEICCKLSELVLQKENNIYMICDDTVDSKENIYGVFAYTTGKGVFHCLPIKNETVELLLIDFFKTHKVFCITGEFESTVFLQNIIRKATMCIEQEVRDYYLFKYKQSNQLITFNPDIKIVQCREHDVENLLQLHLDYVRVEVLPKGHELNIAAEKLSLSNILHRQIVFAAKIDNAIVAKAQTNAIGQNYIQVGGVYTEEAFRCKGIASSLVCSLAKYIVSLNKQPVLFVRIKNISAIHAYKKAGFIPVNRFKIVYY